MNFNDAKPFWAVFCTDETNEDTTFGDEDEVGFEVFDTEAAAEAYARETVESGSWERVFMFQLTCFGYMQGAPQFFATRGAKQRKASEMVTSGKRQLQMGEF